jgi:hypothetical protein
MRCQGNFRETEFYLWAPRVISGYVYFLRKYVMMEHRVMYYFIHEYVIGTVQYIKYIFFIVRNLPNVSLLHYLGYTELGLKYSNNRLLKSLDCHKLESKEALNCDNLGGFLCR